MYWFTRILAVPSPVNSAAVTGNMSARRLKRSANSKMYVLPRGVTRRLSGCSRFYSACEYCATESANRKSAASSRASNVEVSIGVSQAESVSHRGVVLIGPAWWRSYSVARSGIRARNIDDDVGAAFVVLERAFERGKQTQAIHIVVNCEPPIRQCPLVPCGRRICGTAVSNATSQARGSSYNAVGSQI